LELSVVSGRSYSSVTEIDEFLKVRSSFVVCATISVG
jgi:hypothetical protein